MYVKYTKKDENAEKNGVLEVGRFYKIIDFEKDIFFVLDEAGDKVAIPMLNMGIVPTDTKVRIVKEIPGCEVNIGDEGFIMSNIESIAKTDKSISVSYMFVPASNSEVAILCDREDFEPVL